MKYSTKSKSGFTIIEVVLVLAIAALIFLIVFLAVPALQRSQRDTQRRNDLGRLVAAIQSYQANNSGSVPKDLGGAGASNILGSNYLSNFSDPSFGSYNFFKITTVPSGDLPTTWNNGRIDYRPGVNCDGTSGGARRVAVVIGLENGGSYCQTN